MRWKRCVCPESGWPHPFGGEVRGREAARQGKCQAGAGACGAPCGSPQWEEAPAVHTPASGRSVVTASDGGVYPFEVEGLYLQRQSAGGTAAWWRCRHNRTDSGIADNRAGGKCAKRVGRLQSLVCEAQRALVQSTGCDPASWGTARASATGGRDMRRIKQSKAEQSMAEHCKASLEPAALWRHRGSLPHTKRVPHAAMHVWPPTWI